MTWLYLIVLVFSVLTLYFIYGEDRKEQFPKRVFAVVCIMESVVIIATAAMLITIL